MNIYVGNLSFNVTEDELKEAFGEFGEVTTVKIITDGYTGRSKGFGFVEMTNDAEAEAAIKELNSSSLKERSITVNQARPRTDRPRRKPRY
ncbi:MAG: RNA-binding protein [Candidatus Hatepunaea meridiana]|nr:RNA-binding protein [Candidatus Hatepunaea meridiana]